MTAAYILTPELRLKLKEPFGRLIQGTAEETMAKMNELIKKEKPSRIISVGDVVSLNLHKRGINPQLTIIDNVSLRDKAGMTLAIEPMGNLGGYKSLRGKGAHAHCG